VSSPQIPPVESSPAPAIVPTSPYAEDPAWNGWDVVRIALLSLFSIFSSMLVVSYVARALFYPSIAWAEVVKRPELIVCAQLVAYLLLLIFMYLAVRGRTKIGFWKAIRWNWPQNWLGYFVLGILLSLALQALASLLPLPKHLPIDRFFQTTREAYLLAIFGVTFAPLLEELFFRGFLYPVLARRIGVISAILLTALLFGLLHADQLGRSWAPVLVIFLVGIALTVTRAVSQSVAAGVVMHIAYNATISVLIFLATDHFRHLEKLQR
jgi:uncharacterized protein